MNKQLFSLFLILLILNQQVNSTTQVNKNPFKKVIVLMMENHSYDNLLGMMDEPIGELKNNEKNCNWALGKEYCQQSPADWGTVPDPGHIFPEVQIQVFNTTESILHDDTQGLEENMGGFGQSYIVHGGNPQKVMDVYDPEQVPIISTLAKEFTTFRRWFSSMPSCTDPNKVFIHAAQSGGNTGNCIGDWYCSGWPFEAQTIQDQMQKEDKSWSIHWVDWCEAMGISPLNRNVEKFVYDQNFDKFFDKLENGNLEDYTYLVPRIYVDSFYNEDGEYITLYPNTQHPSEDIREGEKLIKQVYEKFRQSDYWNDTLLLVVYDEHGGFYDHVAPPKNVVNPNPEAESGPYPFKFDRLGIRVPSIAISPWLKQGVEDTQLEHASVPKTIHEIFDLQQPYLTEREKNANTFIYDDIILDEKRENCIEQLPEVPPYTKENPRQQTDEKSEYNGTPKNQVKYLGTLLVRKGYLNILKFRQIQSQIKTNLQAKQFMKEATFILGYQNKKPFEKFVYLEQSYKIISDQ